MKFWRIVVVATVSLLVGLVILMILSFVFSKNISAYFSELGDEKHAGSEAQAITDYNWAIFFNSKNWGAFFGRGMIKFYGSPQDLDAAIRDFDVAIAILPDNSVALDVRAEAKLAKNDRAGALGDLNEAIKYDNHDARAHYLRGNLLSDNNDQQGAISDYTAAIESEPDDYEVLEARAPLEYLAGNNGVALADLREMIKLEQHQPAIVRIMIWMIESEDPGQQSTANTELSDYLKGNPDRTYPWYVPVEKYLAGETELNDLLKTINEDPDVKKFESSCYLFIGVKSALYGDKTTADVYLNKCQQSRGSSRPNELLNYWLKRVGA